MDIRGSCGHCSRIGHNARNCPETSNDGTRTHIIATYTWLMFSNHFYCCMHHILCMTHYVMTSTDSWIAYWFCRIDGAFPQWWLLTHMLVASHFQWGLESRGMYKQYIIADFCQHPLKKPALMFGLFSRRPVAVGRWLCGIMRWDLYEALLRTSTYHIT